MSKLTLAEHGQHIFEGARATIEQVGSNPKVAATVAGGTAGMGFLDKLEVIQGGISTFSMTVGAITCCVVLAIQVIKLIRMLTGKE